MAMISFKDFLTESRSAPLYHATTLRAAEKILKDNTLFGTVQEDGATSGQKVIFVTRSIKHAEHYISYNSHYMGAVIFVLDQTKLTQRYKIKPIKNWRKEREDIAWSSNQDIQTKRNHLPMYQTGTMGANEFEEIIDTGKITNFSKYITKIYVNRDLTDKINDFKMLYNDPRVEYRDKI